MFLLPSASHPAPETLSPCCPCSLASTGESYEFECGLDELIEELQSIKGSLLGMGERVRRAGEAVGHGASGEDEGSTAWEHPG